MSINKHTNALSTHQQDHGTISVSDLPPPPSYSLDEEEKHGYTFEDDKRLRTICADPDYPHQNGNVPQASAPNQAVFKEEFYESKPYHQRRVCCLSLFWFAIICDICATAVALLGTMGATLKCRAHCVDNCNDICNPKSIKGLVASLVIFVILSSVIIVFKLASCCKRRSPTSQHGNSEPPASSN